jgi:N,N'-diacetylchitobiose transport system substrate-binding protein
MKLRRTKSALIATALMVSVGVTGTVPAANAADPDSITVWLMGDARDAWPTAVSAANAAFAAKHPNTKVNIEYQTWADHLTKFDATLAANNVPDVIEFGNTEVTKYAAAGALADLTSYKSGFDGNRTWLKGLTDAGSYKGKLYAIPYYAGSRAVIYRTDHYKAVGAKVPTSYAEFLATGKKLMAKYGKTDKSYSAIHLPGKYWYAAMSFVYDAGGSIAELKNGQWQGNLSSAKSIAGLNRFKEVATSLSKADKAGTEAEQWKVMGSGKASGSYSNGWELGLISDPAFGGSTSLKGKLAAYPMPSVTKGRYSPAFLGGSNLAVPAKSDAVELGAEWIKYFLSSKSMKYIVVEGGALPNTTSLLYLLPPENKAFAESAKSTWFVPTAKNWVNVEKAQVLQTMLSSIASGKKSVTQAAKDADKEITALLAE